MCHIYYFVGNWGGFSIYCTFVGSLQEDFGNDPGLGLTSFPPSLGNESDPHQLYPH